MPPKRKAADAAGGDQKRIADKPMSRKALAKLKVPGDPRHIVSRVRHLYTVCKEMKAHGVPEKWRAALDKELENRSLLMADVGCHRTLDSLQAKAVSRSKAEAREREQEQIATLWKKYSPRSLKSIERSMRSAH